MQSDIRTLAYVLRRTNYGEADRILNLITPNGKMSAIAKGVRKEKSKLAGGIEMFSLVELVIHTGKSEMGTITSAKMLKFYDKILKDYSKVELAATILKKVSIASENSGSSNYFEIVDECMAALNSGVNTALIESWFLLNMVKESGEDINLYRSIDGEKLSPEKKYVFDTLDSSFCEKENGDYGANEIKVLRLMVTNKLSTVSKIKDYEQYLPSIVKFARIVAKQ